MLLTFFINTIIMSMMDIKTTSLTEVEYSNFNYLPGRQRNFEFLKLCPYEIYRKLYFESKKIQNETIYDNLNTRNTKEEELKFEEEASDSNTKEKISSKGKEKENQYRKKNVRRRNLSVDQFTVLIIFSLVICYVFYVLVSFFNILRPVSYFICAFYWIFTWPFRMIVKFAKKFCTCKKNSNNRS